MDQDFSLQSFQGPLPFLVQLVQKKEIDIGATPLNPLTEQYKLFDHDLDTGAEFVGTTAFLLWLKSKMLLPKDPFEVEEPIEEESPLSLIHHLIDYCRFKGAAKRFGQIAEEQMGHFPRELEYRPQERKPLKLSLEELTGAFQKVLNKSLETAPIKGEEWRVSDKIAWIRQKIALDVPLPFSTLFYEGAPRGELIATFLAILELMKLLEIGAAKDENGSIFIFAGEGEKDVST
jgi:segregation and condensation protein A